MSRGPVNVKGWKGSGLSLEAYRELVALSEAVAWARLDVKHRTRGQTDQERAAALEAALRALDEATERHGAQRDRCGRWSAEHRLNPRTLARMRGNPSRAAWDRVRQGVCRQAAKDVEAVRAERARQLAEASSRPRGKRAAPRRDALERARAAKLAAETPCTSARASLREQAAQERRERERRAALRTPAQRRASQRAAERAQERREKEVDNVRGAAGHEAALFFSSQWATYARRARQARGKGHGTTHPYELFLEDLEREPENFRAWQAARADAAEKRRRGRPGTAKARQRQLAEWAAEQEDWEARRAKDDAADPFGDLSGLTGSDDGGGWDEDDGPARRVANGRKGRTMASDKVLASRLRAWGKRWSVTGARAALASLESGRGLSRTAAAALARQFERARPRFRPTEARAGAWLARELAARAARAAPKKKRKKADDAPRVVRAARRVKRAVKSGAGVEASARVGRAKVGAAVGVRSNPSKRRRKARKSRNPNTHTGPLGWAYFDVVQVLPRDTSNKDDVEGDTITGAYGRVVDVQGSGAVGRRLVGVRLERAARAGVVWVPPSRLRDAPECAVGDAPHRPGASSGDARYARCLSCGLVVSTVKKRKTKAAAR